MQQKKQLPKPAEKMCIDRLTEFWLREMDPVEKKEKVLDYNHHLVMLAKNGYDISSFVEEYHVWHIMNQY